MPDATTPTLDQIRRLPAPLHQRVRADQIDVNGHMNITHYFAMGSLAPWLQLATCGVDEEYIATQHRSFFTVEHHIRYVGELRLDEEYDVHVGFVGHGRRALHVASFVVGADKVACTMEVMYVHVSMTERRSVDIEPWLAAALEAEEASYGDVSWLAAAATGLSLR